MGISRSEPEAGVEGPSPWDQGCRRPVQRPSSLMTPRGLVTIALKETALLESLVGTRACSSCQRPQEMASAELGWSNVRLRDTQCPWRQMGLSKAARCHGQSPSNSRGPSHGISRKKSHPKVCQQVPSRSLPMGHSPPFPVGRSRFGSTNDSSDVRAGWGPCQSTGLWTHPHSGAHWVPGFSLVQR